MHHVQCWLWLISWCWLKANKILMFLLDISVALRDFFCVHILIIITNSMVWFLISVLCFMGIIFVHAFVHMMYILIIITTSLVRFMFSYETYFVHIFFLHMYILIIFTISLVWFSRWYWYIISRSAMQCVVICTICTEVNKILTPLAWLLHVEWCNCFTRNLFMHDSSAL